MLQAGRDQELRQVRQRASVRSAARGSGRNHFCLPPHGRWIAARRAGRGNAGVDGSWTSDLHTALVDPPAAAARMDSIRIDQMKWGAGSALSYLLGLAEMQQFSGLQRSTKATRIEINTQRRTSRARTERRPEVHRAQSLPEPPSITPRSTGSCAASKRPEPRDLNPTDKTVNHIVERVLRLGRAAAGNWPRLEVSSRHRSLNRRARRRDGRSVRPHAVLTRRSAV